MEKVKQEEILNQIEKVLPKTRGRFAPEDVAAATGYSLSDINDALKRLLELYRAKVVVDTNTGKLVFDFLYPLEKVGKKTFKEVLFSFLQFLWKTFQVIYKAAIGIILIVYTVSFLIILLAILVATSSSDRDRRDGGIDLSIIGGIFRAIFEGLYIMSWTNTIQNVADPSGLTYRKYAPEKNKGKNFVKSIFHFVFGPDNPPVDKFADEKEALAYVRKVSKGKLTAADIVLLTGCTFDEAEERLSRYAVKFGGELEVDENGVVVADFTNMLHSEKSFDEGKIIYYYDEIEPPVEMTGNSTFRNFSIIIMNLFNLVFSYLFVSSQSITSSPEYADYATRFDMPGWVIFALGWFPLIFSITFFLIPLIRTPFVLKQKNKRNENIMRKKIFYALYTLKHSITMEKISELINLPKELSSKANKVLHRLIVDLRGEIELDGNQERINIDNFIKNISS